MARIITIALLIFSFSANAQSHLGKTKEEILELTKESYKKYDVAFEETEANSSVIRIQHAYESLHYYLSDNVCVKFVVTKPYSCNCLGGDIMAYNSNLSSIGKMKWVSKDGLTMYQLLMNKKDYTVIITENNTSTHNTLITLID